MTSKKEEALRLAAAALDPDMLPKFERRAPRVAMNAVTDFTGELGKVEKDLADTQQKLALYEGSLPTWETSAGISQAVEICESYGRFNGPMRRSLRSSKRSEAQE